MNVLILTGRFGMGHYSASDAIREEILLRNSDAQVSVVDIIDYLTPVFQKDIYRIFHTLVNHSPNLYNLLSQFLGRYCVAPFKRSLSHKLRKLLQDYPADLIISTLPTSSQYISNLKESEGLTTPLYTFITDISTADEWLCPQTDQYFVATEGVKADLIEKGIPADKICVCGMPVKQKFKATKTSIEIPSKPRVLIMGGGLGLIPCAEILFEQLEAEHSIETTVIAGKNEALYALVKEKYPSLRVVGFTTEVERYMQEADLIVTKAGGITLFESIYTGTPLYVVKPFLLQEVKNAEFVQKAQIGCVIWNDEDAKGVALDICATLKDTSLLQNMKAETLRMRTQFLRHPPLGNLLFPEVAS